MKRLLRVASLGIMVVFVAAAAPATTVREEFDQIYPVSLGSEVTLENINGSVTVETWDRPEVRVRAEKVVKSSNPSRARESMKKLTINISSPGTGLRIATEHPRDSSGGIMSWVFGAGVDYSVKYRLTVPREIDLDIETTNGGIEASGVRGSHRLGATNGTIRLHESSGDVQAATTNGSIDAELRELGANPIRLSTTNGKITIRLPSNLRANLKASTTNGSIETDFPVKTTSFRKTRIDGEINGGGPELKLHTTNGSIRIYEID